MDSCSGCAAGGRLVLICGIAGSFETLLRKAGEDKLPSGESGPGLVAVDLLPPLLEDDEDTAMERDFELIPDNSLLLLPQNRSRKYGLYTVVVFTAGRAQMNNLMRSGCDFVVMLKAYCP